MKSTNKKDDKSSPQTHISTEFALEAQNFALATFNNDIHEYSKHCAIGFVEAFEQCYNTDEAFSVFIVCGPGMNGLIGLHSAVLLKEKGYSPSVYSLNDSKLVNVQDFCDEHDIPRYDFVPSTLEFYFEVIVDAFLGIGFDGGDIYEPYWRVFEMLVSTRVAIASIDVTSGWDLQTGPRHIDVSADTFVKPEVLVSLGAPKLCSKFFSGGYHFIAGRHLPQEYFAERDVSVPTFPSDAHCVLFSSSPFRYSGNNGEVYGKPGQFNATLFTKNPKRKWVDVEEEMDLWDELD